MSVFVGVPRQLEPRRKQPVNRGKAQSEIESTVNRGKAQGEIESRRTRLASSHLRRIVRVSTSPSPLAPSRSTERRSCTRWPTTVSRELSWLPRTARQPDRRASRMTSIEAGPAGLRGRWVGGAGVNELCYMTSPIKQCSGHPSS